MSASGGAPQAPAVEEERRSCLVHLVRAANGLEPFRAFLAAYRGVAAGVEHELVLLFKGFDSPADTAPYRELGDGLVGRTVSVDDSGFDLGAYRAAAEQLDCERICFLNSFSRPLVDDWLALLLGALDRPGIALVGCGGSNESALSSAPRWLRARRRAAFLAFPNPHLRTNAFAMQRDLMLALRWPPKSTKTAMLALESGRESLTRQVWERGGDVRVIGRDGVAYPREQWRESATFRSGEQRNLLVADNRTDQYEHASPALRARLEQMAWGAGAPA